LFNVGDRVRNVFGLHGIVTSFAAGYYDVKYICDGETQLLRGNVLKLAPVSSRCRKSEPNYEIVQEPVKEWVSGSEHEKSNIISGKRSRPQRKLN
jgi:hypothetical protein